jgi:hypothetical protein
MAAEIGFAAEDHRRNALGSCCIDAEIRLITTNAPFLEDFLE